jgi:hypothetical protein
MALKSCLFITINGEETSWLYFKHEVGLKTLSTFYPIESI